MSLAEVLDDARALSLFAAERLIWVATPKPRCRAGAPGGGRRRRIRRRRGDAAPLAAYLKDPTPGMVLVFEAIRFDFEGDDKRKQERVRKFYARHPGRGGTAPLRAARSARRRPNRWPARAGLRIDPGGARSAGGSAGRRCGAHRRGNRKAGALSPASAPVGVDDIAALVPDARATTIFALVNALGRRDRARALEILDTLTREGEYLPLALAFLSTQFRMALVAREAGLKSPQQIQGHFTRLGVPMWGSRAEQVYQTVAKFSKPQLERAMKLIFEADRGLRDARPDDRIVMEQFHPAVGGMKRYACKRLHAQVQLATCSAPRCSS